MAQDGDFYSRVREETKRQVERQEKAHQEYDELIRQHNSTPGPKPPPPTRDYAAGERKSYDELQLQAEEKVRMQMEQEAKMRKHGIIPDDPKVANARSEPSANAKTSALAEKGNSRSNVASSKNEDAKKSYFWLKKEKDPSKGKGVDPPAKSK